MPDALIPKVKKFLWQCGLDVRYVKPIYAPDTFLWSLLPQLGINCVIDVGAHYGEFASMMRGIGYKGRIASFEPISTNLNVLHQAARDDPLWRIYPHALGTAETTATINVSTISAFSSFRQANALWRGLFPEMINVASTEDVPVKRLDAVFPEITTGLPNPRVFLKVDTQGFDLEVIRGAMDCLEQIVVLQTEMAIQPGYEGMPTYKEAIATLDELGYDISGMFMVPSAQDARLLEFDCVLVRRGSGSIAR